jgi:hypothetical protein
MSTTGRSWRTALSDGTIETEGDGLSSAGPHAETNTSTTSHHDHQGRPEEATVCIG